VDLLFICKHAPWLDAHRVLEQQKRFIFHTLMGPMGKVFTLSLALNEFSL